jgi:diguanylate cyclase (GGDEF)-like protein/PAS domain S-box-containing protein
MARPILEPDGSQAASLPVAGGSPADPRRRLAAFLRRDRPFFVWLVLVQLVAVVPLVASAVVLTGRLVESAEATQVERLALRAGITADALAREVERVRVRAAALASDPAARRADPEAVRRLADRIVATDPAVLGVVAVDRGGRSAFATAGPAGEPHRRMDGGIDDRLAMDGGRAVVGGLVRTPDGVPVVEVATPWSGDGGTDHALRWTLRAAALGEVLREQRWDPSWTAALVDGSMTIVARSKDEATFVGRPATESLQAFVRARGAGTGVARTLDGVEVVTAVARVRGTPWIVAAGLPRAAQQAKGREPVRTLLVVAAGLVLLGFLASWALARRLHVQFADAVGGRGAPGTLVTEFRDIGLQRMVLDNDLIGIVRLRERRVVWHNRALERIFGYAPGEFDGRSPRRLHTDDAAFEAFGRRADAVLSDGRSFRDAIEMVRRDGRRIWVDVSGVRLLDGETLWMVVDVSHSKEEYARVALLAFRDALTGLPNRAALLDVLGLGIAGGLPLAVCFLDLDGFKAVNDTHGHAVGDRVLIAVARRLRRVVKARDTVARLGGDEFVVVLAELADAAEVERTLGRIREAVARPIAAGGATCRVTVSAGVALHPDEGAADAEALLALADARMYRDKQGR